MERLHFVTERNRTVPSERGLSSLFYDTDGARNSQSVKSKSVVSFPGYTRLCSSVKSKSGASYSGYEIGAKYTFFSIFLPVLTKPLITGGFLGLYYSLESNIMRKN